MGLIAVALASAAPHRLIGAREAIDRVRSALEGALECLPHEHGVMPHFVDAATAEPLGADPGSTIDSAWLVAGALWAAAFLKDGQLEHLAARLYERVDWAYWSAPSEDGRPLLRHGTGRDGRFLPSRWDRINGETVFMYVLGAGAADGRSVPAEAWNALRPFYGTLAGRQFHSADLGLFVFQYGLDLLDLDEWRAPGPCDLIAEAAVAAAANHDVCRGAADRFATYKSYWGLSAGDGPGDSAGNTDVYRIYSPADRLDGTAHLTASLASLAHLPEEVLENVHAGRLDQQLAPLGRYGFSNVNVDRGWAGSDMIGIDAGAAVLALENVLGDGRVRAVFHQLPCVQLGLDRLGFRSLRSCRRAS
jgi:hypothetical protein